MSDALGKRFDEIDETFKAINIHFEATDARVTKLEIGAAAQAEKNKAVEKFMAGFEGAIRKLLFAGILSLAGGFLTLMTWVVKSILTGKPG